MPLVISLSRQLVGTLPDTSAHSASEQSLSVPYGPSMAYDVRKGPPRIHPTDEPRECERRGIPVPVGRFRSTMSAPP
jgi:hypothetical protein